MLEPGEEMEDYVMRTHPIKAVRIDKNWSHFLIKESGFTSAPLGDYYFIGLDGTPEILPQKQFDRLFMKVAT